MGTRREDELKAELAEHLRVGNTQMVFDPRYRGVADMGYNNGASLRDRAENLKRLRDSSNDCSDEIRDLNGCNRFHDR